MSRAGAEPAPGAALYVCVYELFADPAVLGMLREQGFRFHHFHPSTAEGRPDQMQAGEFVYYKWMGVEEDMVPGYATSIEGAAGVILSPDEQRVLLIWEYGNWKLVTGAVDPGESSLATLGREMREEVGGEVDPTFAPKYIGGWHLSKARDRMVNDNFACYAVRAKSDAFQANGGEVVAARWFGVDELVQVYSATGKQSIAGSVDIDAQSTHASFDDLREAGRTKVNTSALAWLAAYVGGRCLEVEVIGEGGAAAAGSSSADDGPTRIAIGGSKKS